MNDFASVDPEASDLTKENGQEVSSPSDLLPAATGGCETTMMMMMCLFITFSMARD